MHQALQLTEIFEIVCSFAAKNTLACLARTCRTLEDPSLDALWHELDSAEYALACLLPDVILEQVHGNTMSHQLPTSCDHSERMQRYTSRITVVRFKYGYLCSLPRDLDCLLHVASLPPPEAVSPRFPKLKEISITNHAAHDYNIPLFRYVNGPSVAHLRLTINSGRWETMSEFIASLVSLYPNARRVQVTLDKYSSRPPEKMLQSLSRAIRGWEHLVHGSFTILDALAYEHLCQLETLASFHIDMSCHGNYARLREAVLPPVPFPTLTDIQLMACTIGDLVQWIGRHNLFPLVSNLTCGVETITMHSQPLLQPGDLCNSIAAHFGCQSLQGIHLSHIYHFRSKVIVHWHAIRPLFSFNRLHSVILSGFCTLSMDDGELEALASSWPLLEELELNHCLSETNRFLVDIPTLKGLFKLVEHCPRLRGLAIVIDTRDTAWVDIQNPCDGACTRMVSHLVFGNSPIDDAKRVASILKAIFPFLERIDVKALTMNLSYIQEKETMSPLWNEVNIYLADLSIAVKNERHANGTKSTSAQSHESH